MIDTSGGSRADLLEGGTSHTATPGIVFYAQPNNTYSLYDNGVKIGEFLAKQTLVTWTVPSQLANGAHQLVMIATNGNNLQSLPLTLNFTVDAGPPAPQCYGMVDHSFSN